LTINAKNSIFSPLGNLILAKGWKRNFITTNFNIFFNMQDQVFGTITSVWSPLQSFTKQVPSYFPQPMIANAQ
jgi:hypothetical protein